MSSLLLSSSTRRRFTVSDLYQDNKHTLRNTKYIAKDIRCSHSERYSLQSSYAVDLFLLTEISVTSRELLLRFT